MLAAIRSPHLGLPACRPTRGGGPPPAPAGRRQHRPFLRTSGLVPEEPTARRRRDDETTRRQLIPPANRHLVFPTPRCQLYRQRRWPQSEVALWWPWWPAVGPTAFRFQLLHTSKCNFTFLIEIAPGTGPGSEGGDDSAAIKKEVTSVRGLRGPPGARGASVVAGARHPALREALPRPMLRGEGHDVRRQARGSRARRLNWERAH